MNPLPKKHRIERFFGDKERRDEGFQLRNLGKHEVFNFLSSVKINDFILTDRKEKRLKRAPPVKIAERFEECIERILQNLLAVIFICDFSPYEARKARPVGSVKDVERMTVARKDLYDELMFFHNRTLSMTIARPDHALQMPPR